MSAQLLPRTPQTIRRPDVRQALWPGVLVLAVVKFVATIAFAGRYGYHRDELYYLACARHLALGYVDFPALVPLLAALPLHLFPGSLVALRVLPALAGAAVVLIAGLTARELGGNRLAQGLAAFFTLISGIYLGGDFMFQTVAFDHLTWALTLLVAVRLLRSGDPRWWLVFGVAMGVGLETKYTILGLAVGFVIGIVSTPYRSHFRSPWPYFGGAVALLFLAPNLVWQVEHGWASVSYVATHHGRIAQDTSRLSFVLEQLLFVNVFVLPAVMGGWRLLHRDAPVRALAWTAVAVEAFFFAVGGKSYYATPVFLVLYAAGGVWAERFAAGSRRRVLAVALPGLLFILTLLPAALPVLPASQAKAAGMFSVRDDYANMVGWPEFVHQIAVVYRRVPVSARGHTVLLMGNYGEAGAIDEFGSQYGLPPALSGHLTYFYWKPWHVSARAAILVQVDPRSLGGQCRTVSRVGTVRNALGIHNEEWGEPIVLCMGHLDLDTVWNAQRHYD